MLDELLFQDEDPGLYPGMENIPKRKDDKAAFREAMIMGSNGTLHGDDL